MRRGMCDSIYDALQTASQSDITNPGSGNQVDDIKPSENNELNKTQHVVPPKHCEYIFVLYLHVGFWFIVVLKSNSNCMVKPNRSIIIRSLSIEVKIQSKGVIIEWELFSYNELYNKLLWQSFGAYHFSYTL